jgi:type IV pilus assembly protein PilA
MINRLRVRAQSESGFTLVELLVVMLILGLLAAIAIPAFFNQRAKAQDAEAKSAAKTVQTALETYATDNNGKYTGATPALLKAIEPTIVTTGGTGGSIQTLTPSASGYTIVINSDSGTANTFSIIRSSTGSLTYPCGSPGNGGCPASGDWG